MSNHKPLAGLQRDAAARGSPAGKAHPMRWMIVVVALAAAALSGCAPNPEKVVEQLVEAVNSHDVEAALALFAEDAVVNAGGLELYTGTAEIRGWLEELAGANFEVRAEILEVNGDTVVERERLSMDPWKAMGLPPLEGVNEITVREGLVQSMQFTFTEASQSKLQTAILEAWQPTYANIPYADESSQEQLLDIYIPSEGTPPFPVILLIHGNGDEKEHHNGMAGFFNQAGFAAVLIDYRDPPRLMISDGLCSLAWTLLASTMGAVDDPATELQGCDYELPAKGGMLGIAAYEGVLGTQEGCLSAGWCLAGAAMGTGVPLKKLEPIFATLRDVPPERWRDVDIVGAEAEDFARHFPLYWVDGSEPPYLISHGSGDWVPRIESEAFASRLQEKGVETELFLLAEASHQSVYPSSSSFADIAGAIVAFATELGDG